MYFIFTDPCKKSRKTQPCGHAAVRPRCHDPSWHKFYLWLRTATLPRGYAATTLKLRNRQSLKQEEYSYRQMLKPFQQFFSWPCRKNHPKQTKIREKKREKKFVCSNNSPIVLFKTIRIRIIYSSGN